LRRSKLEGAGVKHGSLTDDLLVDNMTGSNLFKEKYYKFDGEKPTSTLGLLCDIILQNYTKLPPKELVLDIVVQNKMWSSIKKQELLVSRFDMPEFWDYLKAMYEVGDKQIVTTQEYNDAMEAVAILKSHEYSKDIIVNNLENIYQVSFEFDYNGFRIRGILDLITIDRNKKIVWFTDLKTGKGSSLEFEDSFVKYRYYFQGGIYKKAFEVLSKMLGLEGYELKPFQFLYISKTEKIPFLFKMTEKWDKAAFEGFKIGRYKFRGINELIEEIYWCWKNKQYDIPRYIVENNGVVNLKDDFIEVDE
jgi:hypothetical protein